MFTKATYTETTTCSALRDVYIQLATMDVSIFLRRMTSSKNYRVSSAAERSESCIMTGTDIVPLLLLAKGSSQRLRPSRKSSKLRIPAARQLPFDGHDCLDESIAVLIVSKPEL